MKTHHILNKLYLHMYCISILSSTYSNYIPISAQVLDGLGLGPRGPPIPPPASFSVIPYPVKRRAPPMGEMAGHYMFVAASPDDP